jgi:hypothetical protein
MKWPFRACIALLACLTIPAQAKEPKLVGTWLVTTDKDRFTGDPSMMAITIQDGAILAVRCLQRRLTMAVRDAGVIGDLTPGTVFVVKFKGGTHAVMDTVGDAPAADMIEIAVTDEMRNALTTSAELAFRFTSDTQQFDLVFQAGTAARSLPPIIDACPTDGETK